MKKNLTDLLYREIAGAGESGLVDRVTMLLDRRLKGQKLSKEEESVLLAADQSLSSILSAPKKGYQPDKPVKTSAPPPLPFSSFAEGLARLQNRIQKRSAPPQLKASAGTGAYQPDLGPKGAPQKVNPARIAAIVKMAREERAKLKKPSSKKKRV
jgi:hypothetical protein